jgi:hypothetical protein
MGGGDGFCNLPGASDGVLGMCTGVLAPDTDVLCLSTGQGFYETKGQALLNTVNPEP